MAATYPAYAIAGDGQKTVRDRWLNKPDDNLHFVIPPPTLDESETSWIVSDDGRFAISSGSSTTLWDLSLGSPLIVYPGASGSVRFSEYSPHLVYFYEIDGIWSLRDLYTAEIKGFFKTEDIPQNNYARLPDSFQKKIKSYNSEMDYTDMDVNDSGNRIALASPIPMLWNLDQGEPKILFSRKHTNWIDPFLNEKLIYVSPKECHYSDFSKYWNVRCVFASDTTVCFSIPGNDIHFFDVNGNYKKNVECKQVITQLRRFKDYIIAEKLYYEPSILMPGEDRLQPILSRRGNKLPFLMISEISDEGYFIASDNGSRNFVLGQLRSDGTARWGVLGPFHGKAGSPVQRIILSKSANLFSFLRNYDTSLILCKLEKDSDYLSKSSIMSRFCDFQRGVTGYTGAFINDSTFIAGSVYGEAFIGITNDQEALNESAETDPLLNHSGAVIGIKSVDDKRFATADSYGNIRIFDSQSYELLMTMMYFPQSKDYIVFTPDNYYKASKGAVDKIFYAKGLNSFTFKQFDLKYNRPDIILERLGGNQEKIKILHSAWLKRLKRMGYTESTVLSAETHAPQLSITNRKLLSKYSDSGKVVIDIKATDSIAAIQSIHILINDVPLYGSAGKRIEKTSRYSASLELPLIEGSNIITAYCMNSDGQESLHHQIAIENTQTNKGKTLFIAAAGVSEYKDSTRNLRYAASDAVSFAEAFAENNNRFDNVRLLILENSDFNGESLKKIQSFFNQTRPDDVAMLYYAGHGILDKQLNYYLGCSDSDFENPENSSVKYDDFQDILENIPSMHRYCFIDACHSGDIDKDDSLAADIIPAKEYGDLKFRTGGRRIISTVNREVANLFHSMFVDLSHKSGITVVASSNGDELSMESSEYGGGLFTGILKSALAGKSDNDKDGSITSKELLDYITQKVSDISEGRQNPQVKYHDFDKSTVLK